MVTSYFRFEVATFLGNAVLKDRGDEALYFGKIHVIMTSHFRFEVVAFTGSSVQGDPIFLEIGT